MKQRKKQTNNLVDDLFVFYNKTKCEWHIHDHHNFIKNQIDLFIILNIKFKKNIHFFKTVK